MLLKKDFGRGRAATLSQYREQTRNLDSIILRSGFVCSNFQFYSSYAVTFSTTSTPKQTAGNYALRLASEGPERLRRPAVLGAGLIGRSDFEQQRLIERPSEELHGDRHLIGFRSFQAAAVRIARIRHAIIDHAGEAGRHHDRRQAA